MTLRGEGKWSSGWAGLGIQLVILLVAGTGGYFTLRADFANKCESFTKDIKRIEDGGTQVSKLNSERIIRLEEKWTSISKTLERLESQNVDLSRQQGEILATLRARVGP